MRKNLVIGASIVLAVLMLLNVVPFTSGAPINPSTVWGDIYIDGGNETATTHTMTVWIEGVAYGTATSSGPGTWLTVYMVCEGDDISYNEKSGGLNGDLMYYTLDDTGPYIANEVYTFTSGDTVANQHFNYNSAEQPVWGKINEIVNDNAGEDYVYLYFPSVPTLSEYRLSNYAGIFGTLDVLGAQDMSVWGEPNMYYVDLTGINGGVLDIDTLLLEWQGTTTAGGNWVVIDRVEYGHTAVTDPGPENTIHNDYGAIALGTSAIRATNGTDTDDSSVDFVQNLPNPTPTPPVAGGDPYDLWVERDFVGNANILHWNENASATFDVYATNDKFVWDFATPLASGVTMPYTHAGALEDGNSWYYIVRKAGGTVNTNMAYEEDVFYDYNSTRGNKMWVSLPWDSYMTSAWHVVQDMNRYDQTRPNVDGISKWNVDTQSALVFQWVGFPVNNWGGTNFTIDAGVGCYVTIKQDFYWHVNGTDWNHLSLPFYDYNSTRGNKMWISINFDSNFTIAQDVVDHMNGYPPLGTRPNVDGINKWNVDTQSTIVFQWVGFPVNNWGGTNFPIDNGVGYYITMKQDFTWNYSPIQP